jgi:hypothetical protein
MVKIAALCVVGWLLAGCGTGDRPLRQEEVVLHSEVVLEAEEGLQGAVRVDSVYWELGRLDFTVSEAVEIEGRAQVFFRNLAQQAVEIRYELRFFDEDLFLVDRFIPFGQPLRLEAGQAEAAAGAFFVRLGAIEDLRFLTTMRVVARIAAGD